MNEQKRSMKNPFIYGEAVLGENFADRKEVKNDERRINTLLGDIF